MTSHSLFHELLDAVFNKLYNMAAIKHEEGVAPLPVERPRSELQRQVHEATLLEAQLRARKLKHLPDAPDQLRLLAQMKLAVDAATQCLMTFQHALVLGVSVLPTHLLTGLRGGSLGGRVVAHDVVLRARVKEMHRDERWVLIQGRNPDFVDFYRPSVFMAMYQMERRQAAQAKDDAGKEKNHIGLAAQQMIQWGWQIEQWDADQRRVLQPERPFLFAGEQKQRDFVSLSRYGVSMYSLRIQQHTYIHTSSGEFRSESKSMPTLENFEFGDWRWCAAADFDNTATLNYDTDQWRVYDVPQVNASIEHAYQGAVARRWVQESQTKAKMQTSKILPMPRMLKPMHRLSAAPWLTRCKSKMTLWLARCKSKTLSKRTAVCP